MVLRNREYYIKLMYLYDIFSCSSAVLFLYEVCNLPPIKHSSSRSKVTLNCEIVFSIIFKVMLNAACFTTHSS